MYVYCTLSVLLLAAELPREAPYPMRDFLRDPVWDSLGVIISTVLAILAIYFTWLAFQRKKLSYKIISNENVLGIHPQLKGDIKVTFRDKPINDLFLVLLKIKNTGNIPILEGDYTETLVVKFTKNARIFAAEVTAQNPTNLGAQHNLQFNPSVSSQFITFHPFLLNPKDSFTLRILVSDFSQPSVEARIVGVRKIESEKEGYELENALFSVALSFSIVLFLGITPVVNRIFDNLVNTVLVFFVIIFMLVFLLNKFRKS